MDWKALSATAQRLIKSNGKPVQVTLTDKGAYDPNTSGFGRGQNAYVDTAGVMTNFSTNEVDGTTILNTDKKLLVSAVGFFRAPRAGDRVWFSGSEEDFGVVAASAVEPGPVPLVYKIQLRK